MYTILGTFILVLDIVAIVDCIQSSMDSTRKALWVLLILLLPLVGMLLYFILAKQSALQ